ncbi:MAG: sigma factor [Ktedonobacterales bacterium]
MSVPHNDPSGAEQLGELGAANVADDEALGAFYDRWSAAVYGLAFHILRDQTRAEAVIEETFCRAWQFTGGLDDDDQRTGLWLLRLTHSLAVEALRRARAQEAATSLPALDEVSGASDLPAQKSSARPARGTAVEMAFWDGLTCREIAAATGATVAQALNELRAGLRGLSGDLTRSAQCLDGGAPTSSHG